MPRAMSPAMLAAIESNTLFPALLVQLTFSSGPIYLWTGMGNLSWNAITWVGAGDVLGIQAIEDGATVEARGTSVTLSGLNTTILGDCLSEFQLGLPAILYLGLFSSIAPSALLTDPIVAWSGKMDQPTVTMDGGANATANIVINLENRLVSMNVAVDERLTLENTSRLWPGDQGCSFVSSIVSTTLWWGQATSSSGNTI